MEINKYGWNKTNYNFSLYFYLYLKSTFIIKKDITTKYFFFNTKKTH